MVNTHNYGKEASRQVNLWRDIFVHVFTGKYAPAMLLACVMRIVRRLLSQLYVSMCLIENV